MTATGHASRLAAPCVLDAVLARGVLPLTRPSAPRCGGEGRARIAREGEEDAFRGKSDV
jgi:hypothetical protein